MMLLEGFVARLHSPQKESSIRAEKKKKDDTA
jgi:hypothetical protein